MSTLNCRVAASHARCAISHPHRLLDQHATLYEGAVNDAFTVLERNRFYDDDASATALKRPSISALIAAACQRDLSRLYVTDRTHLGRWGDPMFHWHLIPLFSSFGVEVVSVASGREVYQ